MSIVLRQILLGSGLAVVVVLFVISGTFSSFPLLTEVTFGKKGCI